MALTAQEDRTLARLVTHMAAVRDNWLSVAAIKAGLASGDDFQVIEAWQELDDAVRVALWVAPRYGGVLTTAERAKLRELDNRAPETTTICRNEEAS